MSLPNRRKRRNPSTRRLIETYVREILLEDFDGGGVAGFGFDATSPYGMEFFGRDKLANIFVGPFVNAFKHIEGKTKEMASRVGTALKTVAKTMMTIVVPVVKQDFEETFKKQKASLDRIKGQYGKYYKETWDAFRNDDVVLAAFMYRPDLMLTREFVKKAPKVAAHVISTLTGGAFDNASFMQWALKPAPEKPHVATGPGMAESLLREANDADNVEKLQKMLNDPRVREKIAGNDSAKQMSQDAQKATREFLNDVFDSAQAALTVKDFNDMQAFVAARGKKLPNIEQLEAEYKKAKPEDKQRVAASQTELLKQFKESLKAFFSGALEAQVKDMISKGVPREHPMVKDYQTTIEKIKSLGG
jgi:hypothetical protein